MNIPSEPQTPIGQVPNDQAPHRQPEKAPVFDEGRVRVRIDVRQGRLAGIDIHSTRPQLAQRLMAGRSPEEAGRLAGLVFSLCGRAQAAAARAACNAALGLTTPASEDAELLRELAREHAWRLLLDWPREMGAAPDMDSLLALRRAGSEDFAHTLHTLLHSRILGEDPQVWLGREPAELSHWHAQGHTQTAQLFARLAAEPETGISGTPLLPPLAEWDATLAGELAHHAMHDGAFCARPHWQGGTAETGALARVRHHPLLAVWLGQRGRGLGARLLARLLELADLPRRLAQGTDAAVIRAWTLPQGMGVAGVETSRGLLFHVARLQGGRVLDYRILAPTEWNFHPAGPLVQALQGLEPDPGLEARARLVARSLDPCVDFAVEIRHA